MADDKSNRRVRNWCAVVYPDSAPSDWKEYLDGLNIKWACSPLHDKDIDDDGQLKKPHWHIVICYSGNKSFDQVKEDLAELKCPIPQRCRDVRSSVRYFIHKDHPHKYQYSQNDIEGHGGFDIGNIFKLSASEKHSLYKDIFAYIKENDIVEFFDLVNIISGLDDDSWFQCVTDNSVLFERYLKSNRHRQRERYVDSDGVIHDDIKPEE